jgi:hypothetical protein
MNERHMNERSSAGAGFLFCALVIVGLVLAHTRLWLFGEFAEGNHVAQDLHQAGIEPSGTDRAVGFVVEGIPVVLFVMGLLRLAQAFHRRRAAEPRQEAESLGLVRSSSRYVAAGVLGLLAYPPILSSTLSALGSLQTPMIIVSAAPHVMALGICVTLFWLLARSLDQPVDSVPAAAGDTL